MSRIKIRTKPLVYLFLAFLFLILGAYFLSYLTKSLDIQGLTKKLGVWVYKSKGNSTLGRM
ncbi:MAG: hypothetical protein ABIJ36_03790 [Patescibacteria group bacterium]|nr:hypothetical protein [Patescibacteria group bacterium]